MRSVRIKTVFVTRMKYALGLGIAASVVMIWAFCRYLTKMSETSLDTPVLFVGLLCDLNNT